MGLNFISFLAALGIAFAGLSIQRRGSRNAAARLLLVVDLFSCAYAVLHGLGTAPGGADHAALLRAAFACLVVAAGFLLAYGINFPSRRGRWSWPLSALAVAASAAAAYFVATSLDFIAIVRVLPEGVLVSTGRLFYPLVDLVAAVGLLAAVLQGWRSFASADRITRQRSALALLAVLLSAGGTWALIRLFPERSGFRRSFVLLPLAPLASAAVSAYAYSLARIFDWRENGRRLLSYLILGLLFGLPASAAIAFLAYLGRVYPIVPVLGAPIVFVTAFRGARSFSERSLSRLGSRREYREELESALAHIDLSRGRDAVLSELHEELSEHLGFKDLAVLVEDDRGFLKTVYAPSGGQASLGRDSALREHLERTVHTVLLRSEALASPAHERLRDELLELFDALKAEALIFAKEGRRVIGAFAIGARSSGADFTDYDYDTFRSIYGKLFVFAFYLKNVARESILYTVDRELALSDQIIRFALEKVDPIEDPSVDAAWAMRSTRRLGGDFVDFVRLTKDRSFFVLGDVSGKGLSASMNMLVLKSMIRTFLRAEKDFTSLVQRVNLFIKENLPKGSFFAGVFGYFDFAKGAVYFINCGVPAILLYSPSFDAFIEVQGEGRILGFVRDIKPYLKPRKLSLPAGSALLVSTDGVLDGENIRGERFGKDRLRRSAHERLGKSARELADGVLDDLLAFTDKRQEDDLTLLAMKFMPRSAK